MKIKYQWLPAEFAASGQPQRAKSAHYDPSSALFQTRAWLAVTGYDLIEYHDITENLPAQPARSIS
jgi:hypothetical protein